MIYTVDYFFLFYQAEYAVYLGLVIYLSSMYYRVDPHPFELVLEDGEDTLYRVEVWAVGWGEDVFQPKLVNPLHNIVTVMHSEVIHNEADIVEEVSPPDLIEVDFELLLVHRLVKGHDQVHPCLTRYTSNHRDNLSRILGIVDLEPLPFWSPLSGWYRRLCDHGLVKEYDAEASIEHLLELLCHVGRLFLDSEP